MRAETLRAVALVRAVWDPSTVRISRSRGILDTRRAAKIFNPADRSALEVALGWKDESEAEVIALGWGGEAAEQVVGEALAMGVDRGVFLETDEPDPLDPWPDLDPVVRGLREIGGQDLIVVGHREAGRGVSLAGPRLAERLGFPLIGQASRVRVSGGRATVHTFPGRPNPVEVPIPCLLTVDLDVVPRYPSLSRVFGAFGEDRLLRWTSEGTAPEDSGDDHRGSVLVRDTQAEDAEPVRLEGDAGEVSRALAGIMRKRGWIPER